MIRLPAMSSLCASASNQERQPARAHSGASPDPLDASLQELEQLMRALESNSGSDSSDLVRDAADPQLLHALPLVPPVVRRPKLSGQAMRIAVFGGAWHKTAGGLRREDLKLQVGSSRVISKRRSILAQRNYRGSKLEAWNTAVTVARERYQDECRDRFVPVGGKTDLGQRLLRETRKWYKKFCLRWQL